MRVFHLLVLPRTEHRGTTASKDGTAGWHETTVNTIRNSHSSTAVTPQAHAHPFFHEAGSKMHSLQVNSTQPRRRQNTLMVALTSSPLSVSMSWHSLPFWKVMVTLADALGPSWSTLWSFTSWAEPPLDRMDFELCNDKFMMHIN